MAVKATYIYKVMMGHHGKIEKTCYCYARNATTAKAYYKEKMKDEKYDTFEVLAFGDADIKKHPGPIAEMPDDEVEHIEKRGLGKASRYSNRKDHRDVLPQYEFVPTSEES